MLHLRVALLSMALIGVVYAQDKKPDDKKPDDKPPVKLKGPMPTYYKKLGLSDVQVQKILKIRAETYRILEVLTAMAGLYWLLGYPQAKLVDWIHRRFKVAE